MIRLLALKNDKYVDYTPAVPASAHVETCDGYRFSVRSNTRYTTKVSSYISYKKHPMVRSHPGTYLQYEYFNKIKILVE